MKLLALVESPDHVCCRYRIGAFSPALHRAGCSITYQALERGILSRSRQLARASEFDVTIVQRKLLPPWQLRILRRASRRLVYDFDDAVLFRDSNDPRGPGDRRRSRRFAAMMAAADTVVAGNDFLADCALRLGAKVEDVHVIPTCVEPDRYPTSPQDRGNRPIELVWIGSSSTLHGLEQPAEIWRAVATSVPGIRLRVICDRHPRDFPIPIVPIAWSEATETQQLAAGQVGVSWLPDDAWSRGKCGLKILQYHAAGLPVVANRVGCQTEMIRPGINGFLANDAAEWVDALGLLASDVGLRRRMGLAARKGVEVDYSVAAWSDAFVESVTGQGQTARAPMASDNGSPRRAALSETPLAIEAERIRVRKAASLHLVGGRQ